MQTIMEMLGVKPTFHVLLTHKYKENKQNMEVCKQGLSILSYNTYIEANKVK